MKTITDYPQQAPGVDIDFDGTQGLGGFKKEMEKYTLGCILKQVAIFLGVDANKSVTVQLNGPGGVITVDKLTAIAGTVTSYLLTDVCIPIPKGYWVEVLTANGEGPIWCNISIGME